MAKRMMFHLEINCENAAFDGDPAPEVCSILRQVQEMVEAGRDYMKLYDVNGNAVGSAQFEDIG